MVPSISHQSLIPALVTFNPPARPPIAMRRISCINKPLKRFSDSEPTSKTELTPSITEISFTQELQKAEQLLKPALHSKPELPSKPKLPIKPNLPTKIQIQRKSPR